MPQRAWNAKRERQYEHVKEGLEERGRPGDEAEEIAARTVNKERARSGEAKQASRTSTEDISSGPALRGGSPEERQGPLQDDQAAARERRPSLTWPRLATWGLRHAGRRARFSRNLNRP